MPTVRVTSASPAVGTDLMEIAALKPYAKGRTWRKVSWICFSGDTLGQGDSLLYSSTGGSNWMQTLYIDHQLDLKYGADLGVNSGMKVGELQLAKFATMFYLLQTIFKGIECTTATIDAYDYTHDIQPVVDKRWCSPQSEIQLIVIAMLLYTTAPGVTVSVMMGIIERVPK